MQVTYARNGAQVVNATTKHWCTRHAGALSGLSECRYVLPARKSFLSNGRMDGESAACADLLRLQQRCILTQCPRKSYGIVVDAAKQDFEWNYDLNWRRDHWLAPGIGSSDRSMPIELEKNG